MSSLIRSSIKTTKKHPKSPTNDKEEPSKKRVKIAVDESQKSAKKSKGGSSRIKETITFQIQADAANVPNLTKFPSGLPSDTDAVIFQNYTLGGGNNNNKKSKKAKVLLGKDDTCSYIAERATHRTSTALNKVAIGIYNPETKVLQLHPTTHVYRLSQRVNGYKSAISSGGDTDTPAVDSYNERRAALFDAFGSTKKKRVLKSMAANVVAVDSMSEANDLMDSIESFTQSGTSVAQELDDNGVTPSKTGAVADAFDEARQSFLPPFDADATNPYYVYSAKIMAGEEAWGQISRVVSACLHQDDPMNALTSRGKWPTVCSDMLASITMEPGTKDIDRIKCVVLMRHMLDFYKTMLDKRNFVHGSQEELTQILHLPAPVCEHLLGTYTAPAYHHNKSGHHMSDRLKDKMLLSLLIVYVLGYGRGMKVSDIGPLCADCRLDVLKGCRLLREAGFVCKKKVGDAANGAFYSASLSVPLKFPPPIRARAKK